MTDYLSKKISDALKSLTNESSLRQGVEKLLNGLGYVSDKTVDVNSVSEFMDCFEIKNPLTTKQRALFNELRNIYIVFQITDEEIRSENSLFPSSFQSEQVKSFLFIASELEQEAYSRTHLAEITRVVNRHFAMPGIVLFRHGSFLTIGVVHRRTNKLDNSRDVLERVTLIKDIRVSEPHRAHLEILCEISLSKLLNSGVNSFEELHKHWEQTLNTEALNKRFYRELFKWFEHAVKECKFPDDGAGAGSKERHIIRLITRLLFIWFLKEKGLVPEELFDNRFALSFVKDHSLNRTYYYQAVLQNLFFATLNTEIDKRAFSAGNNDKNTDFNHYRYRNLMLDADALIEKMKLVPFVNGGLFDCLDNYTTISSSRKLVDCFTDDPIDRDELNLPASLFFDSQNGLFTLFNRYKFTVEENTPLDQEVALDPELLGQVFENLLAAYNPETSETVRKETGSFYTPRQVVDYMVRESIVETLVVNSQPIDGDSDFWRERLHYLLDYSDAMDDADDIFDEIEKQSIVSAISKIRAIDPAVGSGAFPMGILQTLTLALRRLDPDNNLWEKVQKERAKSEFDKALNTRNQTHRNEKIIEISNTFEKYRNSDFGRKLYLIQNCIYGIDIQPIACQIAKLRFFISLLINQESNPKEINFGIKPLPNLETRFVAADALLQLAKQSELQTADIKQIELELEANRKRHFHASKHITKLEIKKEDNQLRNTLAKKLQQSGFHTKNAQKIAQWDPYDQNKFATWFDPTFMFGVQDRDFDIVIGNPPYVQLQKKSGELGKKYKNEEYRTFSRSGDIYCLFYEQGIELLKPEGHLCFITSNKWMRAGYGQKLRTYINNCYTKLLLDFPGVKIFDSSTVDTCIILIQNKKPNLQTEFSKAATFKSEYVCEFRLGVQSIQNYVNKNSFKISDFGQGPWFIGSKNEIQLKKKIERVGTPIRELIANRDISIYYGIKTGCNEAFIISNDTKEELISENSNSIEVIKPVVSGKDISFYFHQQSKWIIDIHNGFGNVEPVNIENYPAVKKHLDKFYNSLVNRQDKGTTPYNLRSCAYYEEFFKEKIAWGNISYQSRFCLSSPCEIVNAPANFIISDHNFYLLGVLNSKLFNFEFQTVAIPLGRAYEWKIQYIEKLHVPKVTTENKPIVEEITKVVEHIVSHRNLSVASSINGLEEEVNSLVYQLFGLDRHEIRILENVFR